MNVSRGDIVLLDYPFSGGGGSKVRPALVVQNDRDNRRLANIIVVMITSRTDRAALEPTQFFVDIALPDGKRSGLIANSAVNCSNLFTVDQRRVLRLVGSLTAPVMVRIDKLPQGGIATSVSRRRSFLNNPRAFQKETSRP